MTAEAPHAHRAIAIVVAAGRGTRTGSRLPKQYLPLRGEPLLRHALRAFAGHAGIAAVLPVIGKGDEMTYAEAAQGVGKLLPPVTGGASRQESVRLGLEALVGAAPDVVLIHDGARPFADRTLIDRVLAACGGGHGAIPALAVTETLQRVLDGCVAATVAREHLVTAQTPQGFPFAALLDAHRRAAGSDDLTDDAAVAALAGLAVRVVAGDRRNVKLTVAEDFVLAEQMLADATETRSAQGFDVHAFAPGDSVTLCGVSIPHTSGLAGHSDADVGLHALTDALLGTIGDGDIGLHFPPSDPAWRGASSDRFLADAVRRVRMRSGRVLHLDVTLVCELPKIGPHREAMRAAIATIADVGVERVSVKATTSERLGFTGRGEGIAALALATVQLPATP